MININDKLNGMFIKLWRLLLIALIGLLAFFGKEIYSEVYRRIPDKLENCIQKHEYKLLREDLQYLRKQVDEINLYLRNSQHPSEYENNGY